MPLLKPALMVAVLFRVLDALRIYDLPQILTGGGGGTGHATTTLSILVVDQIRQGFNSASALSTITFIIIFLVAFIFVRFLGANVVRTQEAQQKGVEVMTTVAGPASATAEANALPRTRTKSRTKSRNRNAEHPHRHPGDRDRALVSAAVLLDGRHVVPRRRLHVRHHAVRHPLHAGTTT